MSCFFMTFSGITRTYVLSITCILWFRSNMSPKSLRCSEVQFWRWLYLGDSIFFCVFTHGPIHSWTWCWEGKPGQKSRSLGMWPGRRILVPTPLPLATSCLLGLRTFPLLRSHSAVSAWELFADVTTRCYHAKSSLNCIFQICC